MIHGRRFFQAAAGIEGRRGRVENNNPSAGSSALGNFPSALWFSDTGVGKVWVFDAAANLPPAVWRNAFRGHLCDHRFYEVTESTLAGQFDSRYFLLQNRAGGAYSVQPFFFVRQDLAAGLEPGARAPVERLRRRRDSG